MSNIYNHNLSPKRLIVPDGMTLVSGLTFEHEAGCDPANNIWVSKGNLSGSLQMALGEGSIDIDGPTQLSQKDYATCERVAKWAEEHGLY